MYDLAVPGPLTAKFRPLTELMKLTAVLLRHGVST